MGMSTQSANANSVQAPASSLAEMPNSSAANQYSMIGKSIAIKGEIVVFRSGLRVWER